MVKEGERQSTTVNRIRRANTAEKPYNEPPSVRAIRLSPVFEVAPETAPDLPLGEQPATVYLIQNEPLPQWIRGRLAIGSQSLLFDPLDEELQTSPFECGLKWTNEPE